MPRGGPRIYLTADIGYELTIFFSKQLVILYKVTFALLLHADCVHDNSNKALKI